MAIFSGQRGFGLPISILKYGPQNQNGNAQEILNDQQLADLSQSEESSLHDVKKFSLGQRVMQRAGDLGARTLTDIALPSVRRAYNGFVRFADVKDTQSPWFDPLRTPNRNRYTQRAVEVSGDFEASLLLGARQILSKSILRQRLTAPESLKDLVHINDLVNLEMTPDGDLIITAKSYRPGEPGKLSLERLLSGGLMRTMQYSMRGKVFLENGDHKSFSFLAAIWGAHIIQDVGMKVRISGFGNIDPAKKYIIAPTHCSSAEFAIEFMIGHLLGLQVGFVAKEEFYNNPLLRTLLGATMEMSKERFFSLPRSNSEQALSVMGDVEQKLNDPNNPFCPIIFPHMSRPDLQFDEFGNRMDGDPYIKPRGLRDGVFYSSLKTGVPLVPMTINGLNVVLPPEGNILKGRFPNNLKNIFIQTNQTVDVVISMPFDPKTLTTGLTSDADARQMLQVIKDYADGEYRRHLKTNLLPRKKVEELERQRRLERELKSSRAKARGLKAQLKSMAKERLTTSIMSQHPSVNQNDVHQFAVHTEERPNKLLTIEQRVDAYRYSAEAERRRFQLKSAALNHLSENPLTREALIAFLDDYEAASLHLRNAVANIDEALESESMTLPLSSNAESYQSYVRAIEVHQSQLADAAKQTGWTKSFIELALEQQRAQKYISENSTSLAEMRRDGYDVGAIDSFAESSPIIPEMQLLSILKRTYGLSDDDAVLVELNDHRKLMSLGGRKQLLGRQNFVLTIENLVRANPQKQTRLVAEISLHRSLAVALLSDVNFSATNWLESRLADLSQHPYALGLAEHMLRLREKHQRHALKKRFVEMSKIEAEYHRVLSSLVLNYSPLFIERIAMQPDFLDGNQRQQLSRSYSDMANTHNQVAVETKSVVSRVSKAVTKLTLDKAKIQKDLQLKSIISIMVTRIAEDVGYALKKSVASLDVKEFVESIHKAFADVPVQQNKVDEKRKDQFLQDQLVSYERYAPAGGDLRVFVESLVELAYKVKEFDLAVEHYISQSQKLFDNTEGGRQVNIPNARDVNRFREDIIRHIYEKLDPLAMQLMQKQGYQPVDRTPVAPMFSTMVQNYNTQSVSDKFLGFLGAFALASVSVPDVAALTAASELGLSSNVKESLFMRWANRMDNRVNRSTIVGDEGHAALMSQWNSILQTMKHASWMDFSFVMSALRFSDGESGARVDVRGSRILAKMDLADKVPLIGSGIADLTIPVGNKPAEYIVAEDRAVLSMNYGDVSSDVADIGDRRPGPRPAALFPEITMPVGDIMNIYGPAEFSLGVAPQSQTVNFISRHFDMLQRAQGMSGQKQMLMLLAFQNSFHRFPKPDGVMRFFPQGKSRNLIVDMLALDWLPTSEDLNMNRKQWTESMNHVLMWMIEEEAQHPENFLI